MAGTDTAVQPHAGRTALITGGGTGIGLAIARHLARQGASIAIVSRDESRLAAAAAIIQRESTCARVGYYRADVSNEADLTDAIERARKELGPIAILVNNAGVSPKHEGRKSLVGRMTSDEWRHVVDVNLTSAFITARMCIPDFESRRWGRIVSISSVAGRSRSDVAGAHYAAAKAGLLGFSRVLAAELAPLGVTVNCVAPGQIDTGMTDPAANAAYLPKIPVGRIGSTEDVAAAVAYLVSDDATFVTGAVLDVTGGSFMP